EMRDIPVEALGEPDQVLFLAFVASHAVGLAVDRDCNLGHNPTCPTPRGSSPSPSPAGARPPCWLLPAARPSLRNCRVPAPAAPGRRSCAAPRPRLRNSPAHV